MFKDKDVAITCEQGQTLLRIASLFVLPEKLGETPYNVADRALAAQDVQVLYRELKSRSPIFLKDRKICFGPMENWRLADEENGNERWVMIDADKDIAIDLCEDGLSGAYWCLLLCLHPASHSGLSAGMHEDIAWPLAKRLRLVKMLRRDLKLGETKHKRMDLDKEEEGEKKEEKQEEEKEVNEVKSEEQEA